MVNLSSLSEDTIVLVEGNSQISSVAEILQELDYYRTKKVYTTKTVHASFDAYNIIENAIENEYNNGMYEDWDDLIRGDVYKEDIEDLQKILDRILARSPGQNIAYEQDQLIEFDI